MQRLKIAATAPAVIAAALLACSGPKGDPGEPGAVGQQGQIGPAGAAGATGPAGADGQLRIVGDGSGGSVNITANTTWVSTAPNGAHNYQFADLTIATGFTLTVPSGLVLRVAGNVTINGAIVVSSFATGSFVWLQDPNNDFLMRPAGVGIARNGAWYGERLRGAGTTYVNGGYGGLGVGTATLAASILRPGPAGGGGGSGSVSSSSGTGGNTGGSGGGTLVIIAGGAISNTGTITADGETTTALGCGGGGGGVLVLASRTSVANTGTINARGGAGGANGAACGAGGGGGGGIVQLIAPSATSSGNINITGGAAGTTSGTITGTASRMGGGGGGGSGGSGGTGGDISGGTTPTAAGGGSGGLSLVRTGVDPTALF